MPSRKADRSHGRNFRPAGSTALPRRPRTVDISSLRADELTSQDEKLQATRLAHSIDEKMGFARYDAGKRRIGWLCNMHSTSIEDDKVPGGRAGVDFYFIQDDGATFKATVAYDPYFLIAVRKGREPEVEEWIRRKFEGSVKSVRRIEKEDLQMPNHLLGYRRTFLELNFANVSNLLSVRRDLMPLAEKNRANVNAMDTYAEVATSVAGFDFFEEPDTRDGGPIADASDYIVDIREYDVPYHVRLAIDKNIRIGKWYEVEAKHGTTKLRCIEERIQRADPVVLAYDIETTKLPLKFPDAAFDQIMMISYMIDGQGFLITNREIVSEDIADFEYTPKPEYEGPFLIFNEPDEKAVIERFFLHIKEARPNVIASYNGDFFDWPFVEARASVVGVDMYHEIGFRKNNEDIYQSNYGVHMDCFAWVNRDSYLPQGSRGLKAVTVAKLGYDPDELDPELMTKYAAEKPQILAEYSVSDAVATYYLYMKYVHPFIFSLCTIIPLNPDDVLRKGTGTLCEMLLMVQAYEKGIVLPNKHKDPKEAFYEGHLLESETYVGGHVESIEAGVFRSDIPVQFSLDASALDELIRDLDNALTFSITVEEKKSLDDVVNYEQVKADIVAKLTQLKDDPSREERPSIYHLDVASMYPNIMTTNRLQPDSMITEGDCAACDFNRPDKTCDRRMPWSWRGEFLPAQKNEYNMVRHALELERFPGRFPNSPPLTFQDMAAEQQAVLVRKRLTDYSKKIYHKIHETKTVEREAIICQRENPFYVDTVKDFRDRRYEFKGQQKVWKNNVESLKASGAPYHEVEEAKKLIVLYDSLQLAHKVILNSFYGYVMRKGSRWYSMEMAGVTCLTGAHIIQMARELVERIGRPLELDTDGIWCMLPATFPENMTFELKNGKTFTISYPCVMLNHLVHGKFTNHQYQTLADAQKFHYTTHSDNSIFFEVDGPYRAMILPSSKEEDKNLKKRYAVFNHDGSLAELKGFEVKRRGELKLIKIFQTQIFKFFLEGDSLLETYASVAAVANRWLDVLHQHGSTLADEELIDLICENRSMSKTLEEYGTQKSTSITTAKRLGEFLGQQMIKDKGLNCKYIIAARPRNAPVTERAIPTTIFSAEEPIKRLFLRKWLKEEPQDMNPRALIDWDYYLERLGSVIQKLITIPAALQKLRNPVPRVSHPDWLQRRINVKDDRFKQRKATDFFAPDLEDFASSNHKLGIAKRPQPEVTGKRKVADPVEDPAEPQLSKAPSPTDYCDYLAFAKKKWRLQRQARTRRRQLFGNKSTSDSLGGFFRDQAEVLFSHSWQVLEIREGDRPGCLRAFVLIGRKIQSLTVRVSRQLFLNIRTQNLPNVDIAGCKVERVHHSLPSGHPSAHLFRLTVDESVYRQQSGKFDVLFAHPSVEGVFERQIPLTIRAVLQIGGLCTFDESQPGVLGHGLEKGFELSTLRRTTGHYLADVDFTFVFLYHIVLSDRQLIFLFSSAKAEAQVFMCGEKSPSALPGLPRSYTDKRPQGGFLQYPEAMAWSHRNVRQRRKMLREVSDTLRKWRGEDTILLVQSPESGLISSDLPTINMPHVVERVPLLGWQTYVAQRLIDRLFSLSSYVSNLIDLARYADIPLCSLPGDDPLFAIDIAYARRLQNSHVVLWWSPLPLPDHAGYEKDNVRALVEDVVPPSVNRPGTYSTVSLELDVRNLAINTLLTSSLIEDEMEEDESLLENAFSSASIAVLKEMLKAWWSEACKGSGMADIMVQHLVRWVESCSSFLYDPALRFYVRVMSKKAFQQLLADFQRVGSQIVFASPAKLILQTTKAEVGVAYAYTQYILKSIKAKPLFHFLDLEIKEYWGYLIWWDEYNYGGKACQEVDQALETVMHWQMATFLPRAYQAPFSQWVVEYIESTELVSKPLKKEIQRLMQRHRQELTHTELAEDHIFPALPGSHLALNDTNPVLFLVKSLMHLYSLDKSMNLEVRILRADLLRMFEIREFSPLGKWENPSSSLRVDGLICPACTMSRDLDLCRDEDLLPEPVYSGSVPEPRAWVCGHCQTPYDRLGIEEALIGRVHRMLTEWEIQDVKCGKCETLRSYELMEHCDCGGEWMDTVQREHVLQQLRVMAGAARGHQLKMLQDVVDEVLQNV